MHNLALALGLFLFIGLSLGLLGGGGSILAMPTLIYVVGVDPREAVGLSLLVIGTTSLLTALLHRRRGQVDVPRALLFSGSGVAGAPLGALLTARVPPSALLFILAATLICVGTWMLVGRRLERATSPSLVAAAFVGLGVGGLTGFLGVGGGFLIVPALVLLGGLPMPRAVGTSLVVIGLNSAAGFVAHLIAGVHLLLAPTLALIVIALAGAVLGERLGARLRPTHLQRLFAVLVLLVGLATGLHTLIVR